MKVKFLRVKTGSYKDKSGQDKALYQNIGKLLIKDDGQMSILLDTTFNPAGISEGLRYNGQVSVYVNDSDRDRNPEPQNFNSNYF